MTKNSILTRGKQSIAFSHTLTFANDLDPRPKKSERFIQETFNICNTHISKSRWKSPFLTLGHIHEINTRQNLTTLLSMVILVAYLLNGYIYERLWVQEPIRELSFKVPEVVLNLCPLANLEGVVTVSEDHGKDVAIWVVADQVGCSQVWQTNFG